MRILTESASENGKFIVNSYENYEDVYSERFSNPLDAIETYFKNQKEYPSNTQILCNKKSDAMELLLVAYKNLHKIKEWCRNYKFDYIVDQIKKNLDNKCSSFHESDLILDEIPPFTLG